MADIDLSKVPRGVLERALWELKKGDDDAYEAKIERERQERMDRYEADDRAEAARIGITYDQFQSVMEWAYEKNEERW